MSQWIVTASAQNLSEGEKDSGLEEQLKEKAGYMAFRRQDLATKEEARTAAEELLAKLVEVDAAVEWTVSYANPVINYVGSGNVCSISSTPTVASRKKKYEAIREKFDYQHTVDEKDKANYELSTDQEGRAIVEKLTVHGVHVLTGQAEVPDDVSPEAVGEYGSLYSVMGIARHCLISQEEFDRRLQTLRLPANSQSGIWVKDHWYHILGI